MTQMLMFDETIARDESLSRVLSNAGDDWRAKAEAIVSTLEGEVTGEDVRIACEQRNVGPHHPNAWGAFIGSLIRRGMLVPTERYVAMKAEGSHARKTQVYRVTK